MQDQYSQRIVRNLAKEYTFDISALFKYAHAHTVPKLLPLLGGAFISLVVTMVFIMILFSIFGITDPLNISQDVMFQFEILVTLFVAPLSVGLLLMGLRSAANKSIKPVDVMSFYPRIIPLGLVGVLLSVWVSIGIALFVVPGVYLFLVTSFVLPLMAEKRMRPIAAMVLSFKMVNAYLGRFVQLFGIMLLAIILGALSFGLLFIYFIPFFYVLKGKIYMDLFGYGDYADPIDEIEEHKDDATFSA